ncbi:hypothetical protein CCAND93_680053 [Capnocytophaga canis]|uniref:Uncharacterized protein n=1 Tax=Capnocytophaga canis TaxID=1848903 RepID=A0A0B7IVA0_9FLAO|nr:hypothetical protein CCAND93_680053 [Capnocytophaga canis]
MYFYVIFKILLHINLTPQSYKISFELKMIKIIILSVDILE